MIKPLADRCCCQAHSNPRSVAFNGIGSCQSREVAIAAPSKGEQGRCPDAAFGE